MSGLEIFLIASLLTVVIVFTTYVYQSTRLLRAYEELDLSQQELIDALDKLRRKN